MDDNSNFALVTAPEQAGVTLKAVRLPTGYEPSAIHSGVWKYLQWVHFDSEFRPFALPDAGTAGPGRLARLLQLDDLSVRIGDPDLGHVTLRTFDVVDPGCFQLGAGRIDVHYPKTPVGSHRVGQVTGLGRIDEMELHVAQAEPPSVDPGDLWTGELR
jgi:hypothetical protein